MGDSIDIPPNMTEEEVLRIVRELCGDGETEGMSDSELRLAYRSGMFQELCPDIATYAKQQNGEGEDDEENNKETIPAENTETGPTGEHHHLSRDNERKEIEQHYNSQKAVKIKDEADSESESVKSDKHSHRHRKKKKRKHSKDHKRRDRDERKEERRERDRSTENKPTMKANPNNNEVINLDSSESENERRRKEEKRKEKKRKKVVYMSSSSDSDSDRKKNKSKNDNNVIKVEKDTDKKGNDTDKKNNSDKVKSDDNDAKNKIHPFYQDKINEPQPSTSKEHHETKREKTPERKKEPKPFSKYNTAISKVSLRKWRPILHREHLQYQRKFRLKPLSVVCVDLLDFPMVFHHPRRHSKNPNAIPLSSGLHLSQTRSQMIKTLERDKANWFRKKINRKALKFLKASKHKRYDSSDDDGKKTKRARIIDRIISSSGSSSDSSSIMVPNKKSRKEQDDYRSGGKMTKAQKEAEAKKRKLEEVRKKVDKFSARGTRVLPWENKDAYFKNSKKNDESKNKDKVIAEKKKKMEQIRLEKLKQQQNAPSISFQRILKQIETANKEQAAKPRVELKIPKKNQGSDRPVHISEYKLDGSIGVGDVYKEVTKLLSKNVLVECPSMATAGDDLGEYTVKKIAWWILKNEKDPPIEGLFHPECHDDEEKESVHDDDFDWPSDVSSINGCVSDPEGTAAAIPPDPKKIADPDWADDYCGEASLYAKFRKETQDTKDKKFPIDSTEPFKGFLRTKPGTNYSKPNFEVKCFVCNEVLRGQRQYGAHIRSESHKNSFRNYSLDMANYEETLADPIPRKVFTAKLVEYSTKADSGNSTIEKSDISADANHKVGKIKQVRSDSPGPIVGGDAAPNIATHQIPIPDYISLASMEDYDISSDESLMNVNVVIRTAGKWDDDLERKWRTWKDDEAKIAEEYNGEREFYVDNPPRHPDFNEEWLKFWDQRCAELEAEGKDTENHNFEKEWQPFWFKRMQEIMLEKVEKRVAERKKELRIDKHTLRARFGISAEATRRKKEKKRGKCKKEANSSSIKTSDKAGSSNHGRQRTLMAKGVHQRNPNNVHSKPECLPTPPVTDENRERESYKNINSQTKSSRENKSESRARHDKHHKSRNEKHTDKHHKSSKEKYDKHSRKHASEQFSSRSPDNSNARSHEKNVTKSASSISSLEPPPPGEEPLLLGSSKTGRPPPPVISGRYSHQMAELNKRIDHEYELANRKENSDSLSHNSKSMNNMIDAYENKNNEPTKSKHGGTSWADISSDEEPTTKRQRKNSDCSSDSSNTRQLQSRLKSLREALANDEEGRPSKTQERPKVIPLEKTDPKRDLSDGEVASEISDLDINATKGVSTFVNKEIPGLANLDKTMPSTSNLSKNSLGYHLLERKKSTEDRPASSQSDRPKNEKRDDRNNKSSHHKDDRHGKHKGHSSRHDDRNKHKNNYRGSKDDRRKWDKTNNHNKDHRGGYRNDVRSGNSHGYRNPNDSNNKVGNQPPFKNKPNQYGKSAPTFPVEESWEPEDSVETPIPPPFAPTPIPSLVPENTSQIPVLDTASRQPPPTYNNNQHQNHWNGGWGEHTGYPPPMTDHYYNY